MLHALMAEVKPDEIYNLASISRPSVSWQIPRETADTNALLSQQVCEIVLKLCPQCRIFQATSSEIFGNSTISRRTNKRRAGHNHRMGLPSCTCTTSSAPIGQNIACTLRRSSCSITKAREVRRLTRATLSPRRSGPEHARSFDHRCRRVARHDVDQNDLASQ